MNKFKYDKTGKPVYNQDIVDARRRQLVSYLYRTGQIQAKPEPRNTSHDEWLSKRRDHS